MSRFIYGAGNTRLYPQSLKRAAPNDGTETTVLPTGEEIQWQISPSAIIGHKVNQLSINGGAQASSQSYSLSVTSGALALTGQSISIKAGRKLSVSAGSVTLSGQSIALVLNHKTSVSAGVITLSGLSVSLKSGHKLSVTSGALTLTGQDVSLTYQQGSQNYTLPVTAGAITLTGSAITFKRGLSLPVSNGALSLSGSAIGLKADHKATVSAGSITLTGQPVTLRRGSSLSVSPSTITITGLSVGFAVQRRVSVVAGLINLIGQEVQLTLSNPPIDETVPSGGYPIKDRGSVLRPPKPFFTQDPAEEQTIQQEEVKQEIKAVARKKDQADPDSSDFWELHALQVMLEAELAKMMQEEAARLTEAAIQKAKQRELDIAFIIGLLA